MSYLVFTSVVLCSCFSHKCDKYIEELRTRSIEGLVTEKVITQKRRYRRIYLNNNKEVAISVRGYMDMTFWDAVQVGDYITKDAGSIEVVVTDREGIHTSYLLECR